MLFIFSVGAYVYILSLKKKHEAVTHSAFLFIH